MAYDKKIIHIFGTAQNHVSGRPMVPRMA